jgi:hypothetical protein
MTLAPDPDVALYVAAMPDFARPIYGHLRQLIIQTCPDATVAIKWSHPHFALAGDHLCIFAAYPRHVSFTFYKQEVMTDPRLRANPGLPAAKRFMGQIKHLSDLPDNATLTAMLTEAAQLNMTSARLPDRAPQNPGPQDMHPAFAAALQANPAAQAVFAAKTESFCKDYHLWINSAKTNATRDARIAQAVGWIAEGKRRFWQYDK